MTTHPIASSDLPEIYCTECGLMVLSSCGGTCPVPNAYEGKAIASHTAQDKAAKVVIGELLNTFWLRCIYSEDVFEKIPEVKSARAFVAREQSNAICHQRNLRNSASRISLEWYDKVSADDEFTRDSFHMFVLGLIDGLMDSATSPQLPVAQPPVVQEELRKTRARLEAALDHEYPRQSIDLDDVRILLQHHPLPVAQMSGDAVLDLGTPEESTYYDLHTGKQIQRQAASHPSNAEKHDFTNTEAHAFADFACDLLQNIRNVKDGITTIDVALERGETGMRFIQELQKLKPAATVPQVAQSVPVAWLYESESRGTDLVRKPFSDATLALCPPDMKVTPLYAAPQPVAASKEENNG